VQSGVMQKNRNGRVKQFVLSGLPKQLIDDGEDSLHMAGMQANAAFLRINNVVMQGDEWRRGNKCELIGVDALKNKEMNSVKYCVLHLGKC